MLLVVCIFPEPSSSAPEISHVDILPTSSSSSTTSSSSPGKLCLLSKQISYHMFFVSCTSTYMTYYWILYCPVWYIVPIKYGVSVHI